MAPNRYLLKKFGGDMSIEEFRALGNSGTTVEILESPKCIIKSELSVRESLKVTRNVPSEMTTKNLSNAIQSNTTKNDTLRLKRSSGAPGRSNNKGGLLEQMNIMVQ
jgi:hypothetical protein